MSYDKDGITYNDSGQPLPLEQEPDHISDTGKMVDTPWFKDLTQVKRFVQGRAHRSFKTDPTQEELDYADMVDKIFGLSK